MKMSTSPTDYVSTLTPEIVKLAKEQLEEDDERKAQNVNIIREWLKKQPHLRSCPTDSQFLLKYLRGCKYSLEMTKQKLDLTLTLRSMLPGLYSSWDPMKPENKKALSFGPLLPLPGYDHLGRRVAIIRSGFPDPSATSFEVIQRVSFMVWELFCHEEEQMFITGAVLILDMEGYTISHFTQLPMSLAKKLQLCWEDANPVRLKSIDYIRTPSIFTKVFQMFSLLMKEKMKERNKVHGNDFNSLHKVVSKDILPKEYGGEGMSLDELTAYWMKKVESRREWLMEREQIKADEKKRPGRPKTSEEMFGIEGSFRKLTVD